jgi:hypothetical protein
VQSKEIVVAGLSAKAASILRHHVETASEAGKFFALTAFLTLSEALPGSLTVGSWVKLF